MIHEMQNWAYKDLSQITVDDGDSFVLCNMIQELVDTPVFMGKKDLKFIRCNLINCSLPAGSTVDMCNTSRNEYTFQEMTDEEFKLFDGGKI